jgi:protein TonB
MTRSMLVLSKRRALVLVSLSVLIIAAGGIWYGFAGKAITSSVAKADGKSAAGSDNSGTEILLGLAQTAIAEKHLVAPMGSNAYEFYLSVLQLDPNNQIALERLRSLLTDATTEVERAINENDLNEAQRELALLREFDSSNYTLALLGGKLDAARQLMVRQDEERAALIQAERSSSASGAQ